MDIKNLFLLAGLEEEDIPASLLNESVAGLKQQFPNIPDEIMNAILKNDPLYQENPENNSKGTKWLLQQVQNEMRTGHSLPSTFTLESIAQHLNKLFNYTGNWDFLKDQTLETVRELSPQTLSSKKKQKFLISTIQKSLERGAQIYYETPDWMILIPWTETSSKIFGDKFNNENLVVWCTTSYAFDQYMKAKKPLKILIDLKNGQLYQYAGKNQEFRDAQNRSVNMNDFPEDIQKELTENDLERYKIGIENALSKDPENYEFLERALKILSGEDEEGDDPKVIALKQCLDISYDEAEELIDNDTFRVLTFDEVRDEIRELVNDESEIYFEGSSFDSIRHYLDEEAIERFAYDDAESYVDNMDDNEIVENAYRYDLISTEEPDEKDEDEDDDDEDDIEEETYDGYTIDELREKLPEAMIDGDPINYFMEYFVDSMGDREAIRYIFDNNLVDKESIVDDWIEDAGSFLNHWNGEEQYERVDGEDYYIYQQDAY